MTAREIAAAVQRKTRATCRVHPGEDRISVKDRTGAWRDYTSADAAKAFGLKGYLKAPVAPPAPTNDKPRSVRAKKDK